MTDVFHPGLVAYIRRLAYDYDTKTAQLWLAPNQATSKDGAIILIQSLDAEVHTIETFVDDVPSTRYIRDEHGEWQEDPAHSMASQ